MDPQQPLRGRFARQPRRGAGRCPIVAPLPHPFLLSIWFGLVTGLLELGLVHAANHLLGWSTLSALQISRHFPWMIPVANLGLFLGWGLVVVRARPGLEADRGTAEPLPPELPRLPGPAPGVSGTLQDRLHRDGRGPHDPGCPVDLVLPRAFSPPGDHEPPRPVRGVLPGRRLEREPDRAGRAMGDRGDAAARREGRRTSSCW